MDQGVSIKALSQHAGHAQTSVTMDIYAHVLPHQRKEVAEAIGAIVLGVDEQGEQVQGEQDQQITQRPESQQGERDQKAKRSQEGQRGGPGRHDE